MSKHRSPQTALITINAKPLRRLRGWRKTGLTVLVLASIGFKVDVEVTPITFGPVTISPSFEISVPILGQ